jgi:hypothetical protein
MTSKSDHHTMVFKSNPAAVQIYEARFDPDGSQKVSVSFSLGATHWKAMAFEECPEGSANFFLVLKPGIASSPMLPYVSEASTRYEKTGCLWDFMDAVDGHLSIGIPDVSKTAGWDIEHAKKCVNFSAKKSERTSIKDKLKGIQEKGDEARSVLLEVSRTLKREERSAEAAKRKLTYSNVSFNAHHSKFDGDWKEWDKNMTEVFNLKKKKAEAETYIRLCKEHLKMQDINPEKLPGYDQVMMDEVRRGRDDVPVYSGPVTVKEG